MRWIKISAVALLSILVSVVFAVSRQQVRTNADALWAMDPGGSLYLLEEDGTLQKVSSRGWLLWTVQLPTENEAGNLLRYQEMICDSSGTLYVSVQEHKRQVDASGAVQEIILSEEIQAWNSNGEQQNKVLQVDKTTLSQYSTEPYIRKLQMYGDVLLALCCDQGQFSVIKTQPYGAQAPVVLAEYTLEQTANEIEDCASLSDGTLVYSTKGGGLFAISPDGTTQDLGQLAGRQTVAGQLSADETDKVYYMDRSSGVLYRLDLASYTVVRLYNPETVLDDRSGLTFGQLQGAGAVGDGAFCGISSSAPAWVRFGAGTTVISAVYRGWDLKEVVCVAAVFAGTAALMGLLVWAFGRLARRSLLTGRILLRCLPAAVLVAAVLVGGSMGIYVRQRISGQQQALRSAAKVAAARIDSALLDWSDLRSADALQRESLERQLNSAAADAADISGLADMGLVLYALQDGSCYGVAVSLPRDAFSTASYLAPMALELPEETRNTILACTEEGGSVDLRRGNTEYTGYFQPVLDADGAAVGLVEARATRQSAFSKLDRRPAFYAALVAAAAVAALLLWLLAVLRGAFRPLKELSRCIAEISAGNWSVQARITSRDELADIGMNFNQMTEKLNQYISNMVLLNNEYIKFTPRELFQLLGKTKVTDLRLRDKSVRDMSLLYVTFGVDGEKMDNEAYFNLMNENFNRIFDVVDRNHGIIERFDGSGMLALFPWQVRDALNTAISLKEIMARKNRSVELKMLISADETLVGVAGNQKRQTITAISDTIMDIYALNSLMDEMGARYVITRQAVERVSDSFYFNCREIGAGDTGRESLHEFLDGMDTYEKKLHLVTKDAFEQGVHDYRQGRYALARKHFASVLQVNERDAVAMHYLLLCDIHAQTEVALSQ